ncbi:MAG: hypothetical protein GC165_12820 [Armatimonadetes bacterium]|nr:hypothetical protein [Armatimonadota bacterium]MBS1726035.1 hypothetical protein [Armatimonadota bacterium]
MSAFGIFEWRDTRYPALLSSADYIFDLWNQTQGLRFSAVEPPVAEVVFESCADLFLTQLAGFVAKHGRDLQVLLVMAHGDREGLMQTVAAEQHVTYLELWETISETCQRLWQCPGPAIVNPVVAEGRTFNAVAEDIGNGAGHGLIVLFGACHAMGSGESWISTPEWIGPVVGYSDEPNKRIVEKLFVGLSLNHVENFQVAVGAFRSAWAGGESGLSVLADSLNRVLALEKQLSIDSADPHDGHTDPPEGELRIWYSDLKDPVVLNLTRRSTP